MTKHTCYRLRDPQGEIHEFANLPLFCSEQGLHRSSVYKLFRRELYSSHGWTNPDVKITRRPTYFPPEEIQKIVQFYQEGVPVGNLAFEFKTTIVTVRKILVRSGVYRYQKRRWTVISSEQKQEIIRRFRSGETRPRIAREMGISYIIVFRTLNTEKLTGPRRRSFSLRDPQGVVHSFTGMIKDFCLTHDLKPSGVSDLLHDRLRAHRGWTWADRPAPGPKRSDLIYDSIREIITSYQSGGSYKKMASDHGVSPRRLRRLMLEYGCPIRGPGKHPRSRVSN